ncbi:MAG: aminoacyl-tRNA hydrolase [Oscillospiraceae bacterium]|nr:aminoacyl-tRNA hydrolase [Oscillospiraceae bacterium]
MSIFDLFKKIESERKPAPGKPEWIIVGLGNPGKEYETSRHNTGFIALDTLAGIKKTEVRELKFKALCGRGEIDGVSVLYLKPQTFMNLSGDSVSQAAAFYKIPMERVIVIYDDISLPTGKIRIRSKGSAGGHNGIKNIIERSGTDEFPRIKVGVGAPKGEGQLVGWVLGSFSKEEQEILSGAIDRACNAVSEIIKSGCEKAASKYNG